MRVRSLQALLVAGALAVLGVVVALVLRPRPEAARPAVRRPAPAPAAARPRASPAPPVQAPQVTERGFDVNVTTFSGGRQRLSLQAPIATSTEQATLLSGGVRLETTAGDGHHYVLTAPQVRADDAFHHALATGGVRVTREDGVTITADWAEHYQREGSEIVGGAVLVAAPGRWLACERAEYKIPTQEVVLEGPVALLDRTGPRPALLAGVHVYHSRRRGELVVRDGVRLVLPRLQLLADRLDLALVQERPRRALFRAHARRDVWVELWSPERAGCTGVLGPEAALQLVRARALHVDFDAAGNPLRLAPAEAKSPVRIEGWSPRELLWTLTAPELALELAPGGGARRLELGGGVRWESAQRGRDALPARELRAPRLEARFDADGEVAELSFPRGLELSEREGASLEAPRASWARGALRAEARPSLRTPGRELRADVIELLDGGDVRARGQVQARSEGGPAPGPLSGGSVEVRAERLDTSDGGRVSRYRGGVRAWRGEDVITADELDLAADGSVRAAGEAQALVAGEGGKRLKAEASRLVYAAQAIELDGRARLESDDLQLRAQRVRVRLAADGRSATHVEAWGAVETQRQGIRARSAELEHDVAAGVTRLLGGGELAHLVNAEGQESWGDTLTISRRDDRIVIGSGADGAARTRLIPAGVAGGAR